MTWDQENKAITLEDLIRLILTPILIIFRFPFSHFCDLHEFIFPFVPICVNNDLTHKLTLSHWNCHNYHDLPSDSLLNHPQLISLQTTNILTLITIYLWYSTERTAGRVCNPISFFLPLKDNVVNGPPIYINDVTQKHTL